MTIDEALGSFQDAETLLLNGFDDQQKQKDVNQEPAVSLRQLCLSNSVLDTLQSFANLEVLILWKCSFRNISKMPNLKALVLVDSFVHSSTLSTFLEGCPSLQRLSLIRSGDILNTRKDKGYYFSPCSKPLLFHTRNLTEIVLQGTLLPCPDIVHNIQSNPRFTKLSISEIWLPDPLVAWIAHAMGSPSSTLKDLSIRDVQWSPFASLQLVHGLGRHNGIQRLDVSSTLWHPCSQTSFAQYLSTNCSIQEIKLDSLVDPSMIAGALEACVKNSSLKSLALARNHLDTSALSTLAKLLKCHPSLEEVDLSNCVTDDPQGWDDTLSGLATNSSLKSISLEKCHVGDRGAAAIGKALARNKTIESIDLCHNGIGLVGTTSLVDGLRNNESLQRIYLHGNKNESESAVLLRDLMQYHNFSLRVIFLPESSLQEELQYYGALNYAGRKHISDPTISHSLWPTILERANNIRPEIAFYLLQQKPDLLRSRVDETPLGKRRLDEVGTDESRNSSIRSTRPKLIVR